MSNSDYMTEWELKKAKERACGQRLLEAVQNEIRDISEQVVDLARDEPAVPINRIAAVKTGLQS